MRLTKQGWLVVGLGVIAVGIAVARIVVIVHFIKKFW